jgi:hypothetical protein
MLHSKVHKQQQHLRTCAWFTDALCRSAVFACLSREYRYLPAELLCSSLTLCSITSDMGVLSVCGWVLSTKRCRSHSSRYTVHSQLATFRPLVRIG